MDAARVAIMTTGSRGWLTPVQPPGQTGVVSEAEKEVIIRAVIDRLSARFPEAPRPHIAGIVGEEYESLADGQIRSYIPTLIENGARNRLHREFTAEPSEHLF